MTRSPLTPHQAGAYVLTLISPASFGQRCLLLAVHPQRLVCALPCRVSSCGDVPSHARVSVSGVLLVQERPEIASSSPWPLVLVPPGELLGLLQGLGDAGWAQPRSWWSWGQQGAARDPPQDSALAGRGVSGMPVLYPTEGREMGTSSWGVWSFPLPANGLAVAVHACLSTDAHGGVCLHLQLLWLGWGCSGQLPRPGERRA